jgi:hypothetical protein
MGGGSIVEEGGNIVSLPRWNGMAGYIEWPRKVCKLRYPSIEDRVL